MRFVPVDCRCDLGELKVGTILNRHDIGRVQFKFYLYYKWMVKVNLFILY